MKIDKRVFSTTTNEDVKELRELDWEELDVVFLVIDHESNTTLQIGRDVYRKGIRRARDPIASIRFVYRSDVNKVESDMQKEFIRACFK